MESFLHQFSRVSANMQGFSLARMLKMNDISASTQTHLKKTYMALCVGILFSALGSYLHILFHLGGMVRAWRPQSASLSANPVLTAAGDSNDYIMQRVLGGLFARAEIDN